jgi:hypothetical protein
MTAPRADAKVATAVEKTIKALQLRPEDAGAVQLARKYARTIDGLDDEQLPKVLGVIGPSLLKALQALGATPDSRAGAAKGGTPDVSPARAALDELRARRAGPHRAAAVDTSA